MLASLVALIVAAAGFPADPPNDPLFDASPLPGATNEQWDLSADRGIDAVGAWPLSTGEGIVIADVDVGVQFDQPDLAGQWISRGFDFYDIDGDPTSDTQNSHGTSVAGVLAAATDNGLGIAGTAPGAKILPLRTADNILHNGYRLAQAIVYGADHGATVLSMSLWADSFGDSLRKAVRYAHAKGAVIAVASGNEFHFHHHYPQLMDEVLAVGGLNPDTANSTALNGDLAAVGSDFTVKAAYADYGPHLDVVAPTQVPTTTWAHSPDSGYIKNWSGTSAATPHVAATAALVQGRARKLGLELSAGEVVQIIRMTATDLADAAKGYAPGWDRLTGWGRVDAADAVRAVGAGTIPPVPDIDSPDWYEPVSGRHSQLRIRGTVTGRSATEWTLEAGRGEQPSQWQKLASGRYDPSADRAAARRAAGDRARRRRANRRRGAGPVRSRPRRPSSELLVRVPLGDLGPGPWTLRLRATDARSNRGEDRAFFRVLDDPSLHPAAPVRLDTSGESSPQLAELGGRRGLEIVLARADGRLTVLDGRSLRPLRGWPRSMHSAAGGAAASRRIGTVRPGFLATPAVGDIAGGRGPEIVAAGLDGRLYAFTPRGKRVRGFPVAVQPRRPTDRGQLEPAFYASPALVDLDGDGKLDIVAAAATQRVYAFKGDGAAVPGWPVLARDGEDGNRAKILASPAIGDLDGDKQPDIVQATGEAYGSTPDTTGRVHAFDRTGKPLPGWPVKPPALAADSIPLAGEGVPGSAVLADVDGDGRDEVAVAAFTGPPQLYRGDGSLFRDGHFATAGRGARSSAGAPAVLGLGANAAFGRMSKGGPLRYLSGLVDERLALAQLMPASQTPFEHLAGGWDAAGGEWLPGFPAVMEGWQIISGPAVADVDGDGDAEAIFGGSGNVMHAFDEDGSEPAGWPKPLEGWLLAVPSVGDVDGDGRLEIVSVTRDGWLFVHDLPTGSGSATEWPSFRHDSRNTGRYG